MQNFNEFYISTSDAVDLLAPLTPAFRDDASHYGSAAKRRCAAQFDSIQAAYLKDQNAHFERQQAAYAQSQRRARK